MTDRRFIEESFPVKEVSAISAKEKNIRHGHICTLHIWWARRPLASSRATAYAALTPATDDVTEWQKQRDFIVEMSKWENSLNPSILEKARRDILKAHVGRLSAERGEPVTVEDIEAGRAPRPRVLDPFSGGGAIPLEALRMGCETYANDYNPVAVLLLKATLEYPQKFGQPVAQVDNLRHGLLDLKTEHTINPLLEAVKKWGNWVLAEAREELARFYPPDPDGSIPVGYIWARTIPCQNPACGADIPLIRQFWLAKKTKTKRKKQVALYSEVTDGRVDFRIVGDGSALSGAEGYTPWPESFDPGTGTVSRAVATCPVCGGMVEANTTRRLFQEEKAGQRMVAVVLTHPQRRGKHYRVATEADEAVYREAEAKLQEKRERLTLAWGMDPVPDEPLPIGGRGKYDTCRLPLYGLHYWGDLFNTRQQLALITFADKVRQAHARMLAEGLSPEFAKAVATYLALAVDRLADRESSICRWDNTGESVMNTFARQALPMVWDYVEVNPLSGATGDWNSAMDWVIRVIEHCSQSSTARLTTTVTQSSATQLPHQNDHFDAILTDPPYYDNVPYSDLSDFFYVWLKRSVGHLYPEQFATPLTPKSEETVADAIRQGNKETARHFFEDNLARAFREMHRILKPEGIAVIVYAHKSTAGWETVVNALLDSGLVVTSAWPLNTEMQSRVRAQETASLASSIYIVARSPPASTTRCVRNCASI
jgi:adenine-specific DNA methylase